MLSQDWSTIAGPKNSFTPGPSSASTQDAHQSTFTSLIDDSTSSFARRGAETGSATATRAIVTSTAINPGRGGGVGRATTPRGTRVVVRGRGRRSYGVDRQDFINSDGYSSPDLATTSPTPSQKRDNGRIWQSTRSALGKHRRAEPDLDEAKQSRPRYFRKHEDRESEPAYVEDGAGDTHIGHGIDMVKAMQERRAGRYDMTASDRILAREVISLRDRVRSFEQEKEEALAKQRRQLRPGLVTMKMGWRVQERVNELFGFTDIGTGSGNSWAGNLTPTPKTIRGGEVAMSAWLEDVDDVTKHKDIGTMSTYSPSSTQETPATGPYFPPIGYFRHPRARKDSETLKGGNLKMKKSGNKSSKGKQSNGKMARVYDDYSSEQSDVPTESSWASSIPA